MSCNGCRVLRKGCSDNCILRPCLQWIQSTEAQGHATIFVAKFFGRAGLMSFISAVPENQRPSLFQSLLYEAAGRTVNPVNGAVGLLGTGNWHICQAAVDTILRGGELRPMPEFLGGAASDCTNLFTLAGYRAAQTLLPPLTPASENLDLSLTPMMTSDKRWARPRTPSMSSEESVATTYFVEPKLLNLF